MGYVVYAKQLLKCIDEKYGVQDQPDLATSAQPANKHQEAGKQQRTEAVINIFGPFMPAGIGQFAQAFANGTKKVGEGLQEGLDDFLMLARRVLRNCLCATPIVSISDFSFLHSAVQAATSLRSSLGT